MTTLSERAVRGSPKQTPRPTRQRNRGFGCQGLPNRARYSIALRPEWLLPAVFGAVRPCVLVTLQHATVRDALLQPDSKRSRFTCQRYRRKSAIVSRELYAMPAEQWHESWKAHTAMHWDQF